jgi:hypothetical protein
MPLSRSEAEKHGLQFSHEGDVYPSDPDQEVWAADVTIDGHTEHLQGKSEEDVLVQAEQLLKSRGAIQADEPEVVETEPLEGQKVDEEGSGYTGAPEGYEPPEPDAETDDSDVHDERSANDDPNADGR